MAVGNCGRSGHDSHREVTSRTLESTSELSRLARGDAYTMLPLQSPDIIDYIRSRVALDQAERWESALRELRLGSSGPLATNLSSPTNLQIVLVPYFAGSAEPQNLVRELGRREAD